MESFKPIGDRCLLRIIDQGREVGGIYLPPSIQGNRTRCEVMEVSDTANCDFKKGDRVIANGKFGLEMNVGGTDCAIARITDVLAVTERAE